MIFNEFLLFDNEVDTRLSNANIEDNTGYSIDNNYYDDAHYTSSEDGDEYEDFYDEDDYDSSYYEDGDIYLGVIGETDFLNEEANIEALRAWFDSEEKTEALTTVKIANKLYNKKKYKEAKAEYKKAEEQLRKCKDKVKQIESKFISTSISIAAFASYVAAIMKVILLVQLLVDRRDWWKPTTWINEFITTIKNVLDSGDYNMVKVQVINAFDYLINFCKRRQGLCEKRIRKGQYFKESVYGDDEVEVYID